MGKGEGMGKIIHMAKLIDDRGGVSAVCYATSHPIDLKTASWTLRPDAVTCSRCLAAIREGRP